MRDKIKSTLASLRLGNCTVALCLDTRSKDKSGKYHASVRFTINGDRYYFHLGDKYTADEFEAIVKSDGRGRGRGQSQNFRDRIRLIETYNNYVEIVREMTQKGTLKSIDNIRTVITGRMFTYGKENKDCVNSFIGVWNEVISQKGNSTANNYRDARNCFIKSGVWNERDGFNVGVEQLRAWIEYMRKNGHPESTIGIYLRDIRVAFNACINNGYMLRKDYPFSATDPTKINIPVGASRKDKFLTVDQMTMLYDFYLHGVIPPKYRSPEEMKESLGLLIAQYLCNGCNLYDLALMRYDDYFFDSGNRAIRFYRHKSSKRSKIGLEVIVPIIPPLQKILEDLASPVKKGALIFPFIVGDLLDKGVDDKSNEVIARIKQGNKNISDRMSKISDVLNWNVCPSSTFARHSFATNLSRAKVTIDYIGFAMGHSIDNRGQITMRYISPYPIEEQMQYNSYLLDLPELKSLRQKEMSKEALMEMVKKTLSKEEFLKLALSL